MENGSILPQALDYMQKLRDSDLDHSTHSYLTSAVESAERNSLIVSLYHISNSQNKINVRTTPTSLRSDLHQKLATIHSILHTKLLPQYEKNYSHSWYAGGEGIVFGLHCSPNNDGREDGDDTVPHLRAMIHYGPNPFDEYFALAIVFQLTKDLHAVYNMRTVASCWDADDGQILLIEGADSLPSWVDDDIGVKGMTNRVFVMGGEIVLLPPNFTSSYDQLKRTGCLTIREALLILTQNSTIINPKHDHSPFQKELIFKELNDTLQRKLDPFLQVIQKGMKNMKVREILMDHVHTAAIVLPLDLALLIRRRSDLVSCAILAFCKYCQSSIKRKPKQSRANIPDRKERKEDLMPFENLVFTTITLSKTLYAMLLTAAGKIQPPIKIPKRYKSIEYNRMKRQVASGDVSHYFRHALEVGVRLTLGFEWLLSQDNNAQQRGSSLEGGGTVTSSTENRILLHHTRIDVEAGGNGEWISGAWAVGPNSTHSENNITALIKCPVWYPEITNGGICPLRYPGKTISAHIVETLKSVRKEETTREDILNKFPIPRICDVDSDSWVDMGSIDALETKMNNVVCDKTFKTKMQEDQSISGNLFSDMPELNKSQNYSQCQNNNNINAILNGLQSFMKSDSGTEGVVMGTKRIAPCINANSHQHTPGPKSITDKIHIDRGVFISTLYNFVSEHSAQNTSMKDYKELSKYFTREDLNELGQEESVIDDDMECNSAKMHCLMNTMDEELIDHKLDRIYGASFHDGSTCDIPGLSPNHPIAQDFDMLSNLTKSLETQGGSSGPVKTILDEMGIEKPDCS